MPVGFWQPSSSTPRLCYADRTIGKVIERLMSDDVVYNLAVLLDTVGKTLPRSATVLMAARAERTRIGGPLNRRAAGRAAESADQSAPSGWRALLTSRRSPTRQSHRAGAPLARGPPGCAAALLSGRRRLPRLHRSPARRRSGRRHPRAAARSVGDGGHALITTPAATKFYRSDGRVARQLQDITLDAATFEWLPQETILFPDAYANIATRVHLSEALALHRLGDRLLRPARQWHAVRERPRASGFRDVAERRAAGARSPAARWRQRHDAARPSASPATRCSVRCSRTPPTTLLDWREPLRCPMAAAGRGACPSRLSRKSTASSSVAPPARKRTRCDVRFHRSGPRFARSSRTVPATPPRIWST